MNFDSPSLFCTSLRSTAIAISAFLAVGIVHASVVVNFNNYGTGQLQGQTGGTGLTGTWAGNTLNSIVSGDLSGPAASSSLILPQTGGTPQKMASGVGGSYGNAYTYITLGTSINEAGWVSFVGQTVGTSHRLILGYNVDGIRIDLDDDFNTWADGNGGTPGDDIIEIRSGGLSTAYSHGLGTDFDFFIVMQMEQPGGAGGSKTRVNLWLNPTSENDILNNPNGDITRDVNVANLAANGIQSIGVGGYVTASYMDNIRIGTSLNDVIVVPEPQTLVFFLIGIATLLYFRRIFMKDQRIA